MAVADPASVTPVGCAQATAKRFRVLKRYRQACFLFASFAYRTIPRPPKPPAGVPPNTTLSPTGGRGARTSAGGVWKAVSCFNVRASLVPSRIRAALVADGRSEYGCAYVGFSSRTHPCTAGGHNGVLLQQTMRREIAFGSRRAATGRAMAHSLGPVIPCVPLGRVLQLVLILSYGTS